jgi:hypothetical protein
VAGALWRATVRERVVLTLTVVLALAFPVLFYAWVYRFSGFGLQGRYTLPVLTLIPMLAGELLHRHAADRAVRGHAARWALTVSGVVVVIAGVQAYAWWHDLRRTAQASGLFTAHAGWGPPGGWWLWIVVAALGVLCLLVAAVQGLRPRGGDGRADLPGLAPATAHPAAAPEP